MAASKQPKDISDIVNLEELSKEISKPQEYFEEVLILTGYELLKGEKGEYYLLSVVHEETQAELLMSSSAWQVKKVLQSLTPRHLPMRFKFRETGNSYAMVSAKAVQD